MTRIEATESVRLLRRAGYSAISWHSKFPLGSSREAWCVTVADPDCHLMYEHQVQGLLRSVAQLAEPQ